MGRVLAIVFAALGMAAGLAPAVRATDAPRTTERALPTWLTAGARWQTPPLRVGGGFQLAGAVWRSGRGRVELRTRLAGGRWTRWAAVDNGDPVWSGAADAAQVRGTRTVRGLRVRFVWVGAAAPAGLPRAVPAAAGDGPPIVPRSAWDPHDTCRPSAPTRYGRVDFAVVHHTESLSSYSPRQSAAMVLGICLFHRDGRGWNDIGYDLLVDRYGTIFEGRAGGVEQPVVGAQAGGWNDVSTGVAMLGSYGAAAPPPPALRALERVLAWKLSLAGVPAIGAVTERSTGEDPGDNRWPRGALVRFQRIAGHRDADATDCPGGALYALLPRIRRAVAALMPPPADQLTLSPLGAPVEQAPVPLTGRLSLANGRRPAAVEVDVQQQGPDGAWRAVATTRTGADGIWSAAPTLLMSGALRAVAPSLSPAPAPSDPGSAPTPVGPPPALVSPAVPVRVDARVALRLSTRHLGAGGTLQIAGVTTPAKARVVVLIARRIARGHFTRGVRVAVAVTDGRFTLAKRLARPGVYRVLARTPADALNAPGVSAPVLVRVLR